MKFYQFVKIALFFVIALLILGGMERVALATDNSNDAWVTSGDYTYIPSGNVGIGTGTPSEKLTVRSSIYAPYKTDMGSFNPKSYGLLLQNYISSTTEQYPNFFTGITMLTGNGSNALMTGFIGIVDEDGSSGTTGRMVFGTRDPNYGHITEKMAINENGNVGIGMTNPTEKLSVKSSIYTPYSQNMGSYNPRSYGLVLQNINSSSTEQDPNIYTGITMITGNQKAFMTGFIGIVDEDGSNGTTGRMVFGTRDTNFGPITEKMAINESGNVGIGCTNPQTKLAVNGTISAKAITVQSTIAANTFKVKTDHWSDYVFDKTYTLPSLMDVEKQIKMNKHLTSIPTAAEIKKNGLDMADIIAKQMAKIEELTLYLIKMNKTNAAIKKEYAAVKLENTNLKRMSEDILVRLKRLEKAK